MLNYRPKHYVAAFGEACPSYTTIVNSGYESAFKTFKNLVTQEPDGFCKLLFSDGSDWFQHVRCELSTIGHWAIYCHKYQTISSHDAKLPLTEWEAIQLVREKRRKMFQDYLKALHERKRVILYRSQHSTISFESTYKIYSAVEELNKRGARFTLVMSQGGDGPQIPMMRELLKEKFANFHVPTWDFITSQYNQEEFDNYNKCSAKLLTDCYNQLIGLKSTRSENDSSSVFDS